MTDQHPDTTPASPEGSAAASEPLQEAFVGPGGCERTLEDLMGPQEGVPGLHGIALVQPPMDLIDQMRNRVREAVMAVSQGEQVTFSTFGTLLPGQDGQPQPVGVVVLAIPSGVDLGQQITSTSFVPNLWCDQEAIEGLVRQTVEGMLAQRSQLLAKSLATPGQDGGARVLHLPGS